MSYSHGVYVSEVPTQITPPVTAAGFLPVVVGTAPVNLASNPKVNEPVLCYSYPEAVAALGYSDDYENYTLCEQIYAQFALFGVAPVVFINVLDPAVHKTSVTAQAVTLSDGTVEIADLGVLPETLVVKSSDGVTTHVLGTDYLAAFNDDGKIVISRIVDGDIATDSTELQVDFDKLDPSAVTSSDIIGGVDVNGVSTGLELINEIFSRFRISPTHAAAPGYSTDPAVRAVGVAKMRLINNNFRGQWLGDIPTDSVTQYADVAAWKNSNNYTAEHEVACWPKVKLGNNQFHLSTQVLCIIGQKTASNDGILNVTPSNESLQADSSILADGTEVFLQWPQANLLNGQGIVTALNHIGGWKAWGNRTAAYPANSDPKDSFIKVRGFQNWLANTLILTFWQKVDGDLDRRQVESITDSGNIFLNSLVASNDLLGGRIEFLPADNSTVDLLDGKATFRVYQAASVPNRVIDFILEYDADYLETLFN